MRVEMVEAATGWVESKAEHEFEPRASGRSVVAACKGLDLYRWRNSGCLGSSVSGSIIPEDSKGWSRRSSRSVSRGMLISAFELGSMLEAGTMFPKETDNPRCNYFFFIIHTLCSNIAWILMLFIKHNRESMLFILFELHFQLHEHL